MSHIDLLRSFDFRRKVYYRIPRRLTLCFINAFEPTFSLSDISNF